MTPTPSLPPIPIESDRLRLDFKKIDWERQADGTLVFEVEFDPRRYEWIDGEAGRMLHDLRTDFMYPEAVINEFLEGVTDLPTYGPPAVPDAETFIPARREVIKSALRAKCPVAELADPSAEVLAGLMGSARAFAVVSIDLVGSTRLQATNSEAYNTVVPLLLNEIGVVTALFDGIVIKNTGDGAIIGFPEPAFCVRADAAFDAACAVAGVVYAALNPAMREVGLPPVEVRIGADAHEGLVAPLGSERSRRQADLLSLGVSLATKVEKAATPREVWVGQGLYEILHISRQDLLEGAPAPEGWEFVDRGGDPYKLFRLRL